MTTRLEEYRELAGKFRALREEIEPLLLRASRLEAGPTLDNETRNCARDVTDALDRLIRRVAGRALLEN